MMFEGENEDDSFGDQSGVFGDVNNDGYLDALVGASALSSESSKGEAYNGKAILYFGPFATEDLQDKIKAQQAAVKRVEQQLSEAKQRLSSVKK